VREARRHGKPVVASMGDVAASGAYLVAAGADLVVAEPSTLTGSIGVFALKADLSGLLGKLGVALASDQRGQ
jgi:protease-4